MPWPALCWTQPRSHLAPGCHLAWPVQPWTVPPALTWTHTRARRAPPRACGPPQRWTICCTRCAGEVIKLGLLSLLPTREALNSNAAAEESAAGPTPVPSCHSLCDPRLTLASLLCPCAATPASVCGASACACCAAWRWMWAAHRRVQEPRSLMAQWQKGGQLVNWLLGSWTSRLFQPSLAVHCVCRTTLAGAGGGAAASCGAALPRQG